MKNRYTDEQIIAPTTLVLGNREAVAKTLNLPDTMSAFCLIRVGYSLVNFGPVTRKPNTEIMRFERWS